MMIILIEYSQYTDSVDDTEMVIVLEVIDYFALK